MAERIVPERFLDAAQEPEQTLTPIRGYEKSPLVSLKEAIQPIKSLLYDVDTMIEIAKRNSKKPADNLTSDESAAIHLCTMQWPPPHPSLFTLLNERLRSEDRNALLRWFLYLKLFFTALYKIPSYRGIIWRGVQGNTVASKIIHTAVIFNLYLMIIKTNFVIMNSSGPLERQTIGRHGFIGSLYDIRTDKLEGTNLFNKKLPESFIEINDSANLNYELDFNNSRKETFDKFNIEGSLKLSLMSGLIKIGGSAKYLQQTKEDSHTVRVTYICKIKTKQEHLQISMADLHEYFSPDALENLHATHVVTGIIWGANVAATFEQEVQDQKEVKEIEGNLSLVLKGVPVSGKANTEYENKNKSEYKSLKISFSGDLLHSSCPQTVEGVLNLFENIPDGIKSLNNGKGKQLVFVLYPLERMAQIFKHQLQSTRLINEVSDILIIRIENLFEEISTGKRKFHDFLEELKPWRDYLSRDWLKTIQQKQTELNAAELKIKQQVSILLQQIRGNQKEESEMEKLLEDFNDKNPCSLKQIEHFLREKQYMKLKVETIKQFNREINLLKEFTSIEDKISDLYDKQVYLLHISTEWHKEDKQNTLKQIRYFKNLMINVNTQNDERSQQQNSNTAFIVIDYDLHHADLEDDVDRAKTCCIYYAKHGAIESKDYYEYSLKTLTPNQITSILKENSKLSEGYLLNWHKTFINEHPTGELTKNDLVSELKKLYPNGNATNYVDYMFTVIDKDKNGKINFCEFMSVVALTSIGNNNMEKQLSLIFDAVYKNTENEINAKEFVEFIQIFGELVDKRETVTTHNVKSIVNQMFRQCGKNDALSKEEFINCCKNNKRICCAFLPDSSKKIIWKQNGITIAGGNRQGDKLNQLCYPWGISVDDDQTIYIADHVNHRIVQWKSGEKEGKIIAGGNGEGNRIDQLNYPTDVCIDQQNNSLIITDRHNRRVIRCSIANPTNKQIIIENIDCYGVAMDKDGSIYVSDGPKNEVKRWKKGEKEGTIVTGRNQLNSPTHLFVDTDYSIYVSDSDNHRVMKWKKDAEEGIVVAGGSGQGNQLNQLSRPWGVVVDHLGYIYVTDFDNHRVMRWCEGCKEGEIVVGGNGNGDQSNQFFHPNGLSFDVEGNLYVADMINHRIQKFEIDLD